MAEIELVIKIPEEAKQAFDCAESNDLKGCYYDHGGVIGKAIKNGTPLPKGHGRLIEAKRLKEVFRRNTGYDYHDLIDIAPTIIEADKEYEAEVITRGNCMMCGKELTEGLFFCKSCADELKIHDVVQSRK